jgi:hypothetical protein
MNVASNPALATKRAVKPSYTQGINRGRSDEDDSYFSKRCFNLAGAGEILVLPADGCGCPIDKAFTKIVEIISLLS